MAGSYPIWLDTEVPADSSALIRRMLVISLVLHLAGLALLAGIRFTPRVERLQATEVTLVSLPQAQPEAAPVQPAPQPVPKVEKAEPLPPSPQESVIPSPLASAAVVPRPIESRPIQQSVPPAEPVVTPRRASAPVASPKLVLPSLPETMTRRTPDNRLRDALRGIERPPEAPRLGSYRPAPVPVPPVAEPKTQEKLPSLSDLARQLEDVQHPQPKPAVASKPKPTAKPATKIQVSGDESGLSRYLAIVQSRISEQWVAPPVDVANRSYQVIIKFRLHRSGRISDVVIERESGNGYYDDAGKRAVLSVGALPPFPPYVAEDVLETHFSFTVGEEVG